jgi:hypothetical protein
MTTMAMPKKILYDAPKKTVFEPPKSTLPMPRKSNLPVFTPSKPDNKVGVFTPMRPSIISNSDTKPVKE